MSWNIGSSRNIFLSLRKKSKVFHVRLHYELKKSSYTVLEALNFAKIDKLDSESNFSELKWVIHNGLRRTTLIYQSDKHEISISQHHWNGVQWSFLTKIELKKGGIQKIFGTSSWPSFLCRDFQKDQYHFR